MANLKIEFQKPKLTLCNTNYIPLGILTNKTFTSAHNITLTSKVNETPYLTFDMPLGGLIDNNSTELLVKHKNDYFVIKNIQMASGDSNSMVVTAEHIACELKGIVVSYFEDLIGETPENMWNTIVANSTMPDAINSRYIFETNIVDTYRYLSGEDEKSVFEHLVDIAEQFEACLLFSTDADGIIHIKLLYGDIDRGKFIRKGKDLKQLNLTFNTESLFTKVTPFGAIDDNGIELTIMDLNDGKSYLTNYDYYLAKGMTMKEISANPLCNQECIYRNSDIVDAEDLLRLGQQELKKLSEPVVNGSVEVIDLGVFEGSLYLSPILCEKIIVIDKDINYSISCKITEIEFTYDNPLESKISISNVVKYSSALKELIKTSDAVSEILTNGLNGKPNLNASKVKGLIDGHIAQLKYSMENNITDITDAVILFENRIIGSDMFGALAIGSRGILISREIDPITNQFVWTTALDSHGLSTQIVNAIEINASQIRGDILSSYDVSTWIDLNTGEFNFKDKIKFIDNKFSISLNNGGTIDDFVSQYEEDKAQTDKELAELNNALDNVGGTIDGSFKDGIIDEVEMLNIKEALKILEKEKLDVDARYNNIYNNVSLIGNAKTNLKTQYDNFVTKYNNLVSIINTIINDGLATDEEVIQYEAAFNSYNQSIPPLSTAFDVAIEIIANNNTETQIGELKDALDTDIKNANDSIANLEETMNGSFKDGIIDEAEYIAIKESLTRLETEKTDIDKNYQSLYNNANISNNTKTELKTKYDNYNKAHDFLVNYINVTIGDRIATQSEISVIKSKLTEYNTALSEYSVAQTKAINDIAENSANANLQNYKKLVDQDISDINQKINDMTIDIGGVIADGIIDEAEALIIQNNITELNKEKADIDERYKNIYNNTNLNNTAEKTNLANKYNSYNTAHNNLINTINTIAEDKVVTTSEKSDFDTAVNNYNIKLSQLSMAFDNAINKISENMANSIMESLRTELQGNINDVSNLVSNLNNYVDGAFKDGILTESEKDSIRTYLVSLNTEKKDIDQQYTSLYNNADLIGTAKTNLKTAYDTYVKKYNNLVSKINATLELTTISDSSRKSLNTAFGEHDTALATYSKRVNEAIDSIAEKKKEDAKSYTDVQFNILNDKIELRVTSKEVQEMVDSSISESNAYADTLFQDAKNQIDGKIESYYQTTDPSKSWTTTALKTQHTGDIWHDSLNNITYRWGGKSWVKLTDADAEQAKTIASSKAKVFTTTPTTPYKVGDLWVQGSNGDIMRCTYARSSGNYVSSDWAKASKYTDDTKANQVANNLKSNYYNIKETDSAINVMKDGILSEVSSKYTTKDSLGNTLSEYATKSEMKQTGESITAKFTEEHNNGYEQGIVAMNKNGITVTHTDVNSVTKMMAKGFYIEDSKGETIASLSSKEQWSELKADKVFANNIENVYEGDANLYVDHSKTVVGNGSANSPFSCFNELRDYLEKAPIINKDLTINVVSTGTVSDTLYLRGLKGRGAITININKVATYVDKSNTNSFIYLYDVQNIVTIKGGRTGYDKSDGALISGYKYGVFANNCRYVRIEYIAINTKSSAGDQWGVIFNATNGMTYRVDFCDSPNAVYADRSSQVYDADSCGNGKIAFRSANGSSIMFGSSQDNGYRPSGSLIKGGGNIVDLGNRSVRTSFRTAPAVPSKVNQYKDFSFSNYGYYSEGYGNWNSIGYKTVYQGNWG